MVGDGASATSPCGGFVDFYGPDHGTAVASVVAGVTNGVAKNVTIVPVKVWTCFPNGSISSSILYWCWGLDWILSDANGQAAVVNISGEFSAYDQQSCPPNTCVNAFEHNVREALLHKLVVVAAAGNENTDACGYTPARMGYGNSSFDVHVITVGGSTEDDQRWVRKSDEMISGQNDFGSNYGRCVDIYAPAQHFFHLAHMNGNSSYRDPATHIEQTSGTSFSAPLVSGMAARLLQMFPAMTVEQVWQHILAQANHPGCFDFTVSPCNDRLAYISPYE